jgi:hypothetical protein
VQELTYELFVFFGIGCFLLVVVGVQYYIGKVYTRGGNGEQWHNKSVVSREEAPHIFWSIIGLQFIIGVALVLVSVVEIYDRLY